MAVTEKVHCLELLQIFSTYGTVEEAQKLESSNVWYYSNAWKYDELIWIVYKHVQKRFESYCVKNGVVGRSYGSISIK